MKSLFLFLLLLPVFASGQVIETIAGSSVIGYSGNGGPLAGALFSRPDKVIFDPLGNLYIVEENNNVVRKISTSGIVTTYAGNGTYGYSGDGEQATNAQLHQPGDIFFDKKDNLYIAEFNSIRKVSTSGIISTVGGTGVSGYSGDGAAATNAQMYDPIGLVFDKNGNLFFADGGYHCVRKIDTLGIITTIAGNGTPGFSADGTPATAALLHIVGYMALSPAGELYMPCYDQRVRKIDATGIIRTVAGTGANSYTGDGGQATNATLMQPIGVMFDAAGNLYISDDLAYVVRKVTTDGIITTIAGKGTPGFSGDGGPATNAQFNDLLNCSAIDAYGNLYIGDPVNNRIRRIVYDEAAVNDVRKVNNDISIFPNPAQNEVTIKSNTAIESVAVVNMMGQVVVTSPFGKGSGQAASSKEVLLDIRSLPAGVYFVKVNGPDGYRDGGRFVKE